MINLESLESHDMEINMAIYDILMSKLNIEDFY